MKEEIKEISIFDANLEKNIGDFMEAYKMVDVDQVYSNGTEFVPIFRVKQWLEYNDCTPEEYNTMAQSNMKLSLENEKLNNIIKNLDKMFEYYFLGNLKYDQDTVNTIYIKYVKLKELKEGK